VIDLSALWAGPLCGGLLAAAGARVIKVECIGRPDTIRRSSPVFFDLLNAHKESLALDFTRPLDRARLRSLIARADVVISSARPRAFERLELVPESLVAEHAGLTWVAITAHGWSGPRRNWVGFGDDAAAAGGLVTFATDGSPMFAGDALADPLTGIAAAAGALQGIARGGGVLIDASLAATAAFVAAGPRIYPDDGHVHCERGGWLVSMDEQCAAVRPPRARLSADHAPRLGADNRRVLAQLLN
jgi:crotonobetainyl-CoA:carnitine CoA-transferase CaiB-like acyl-CoA transferase